MRLFSDNRNADKSQLIDGHINDYETGWSGSASEVYDRYVAAGKDPSSLVARYHR